MPALRGFPRHIVEKVFLDSGIYLLQKFPDGQTRWGNQPPSTPFKGKSLMMQNPIAFGTIGDSYDIFSIRAVLHKLAPEGKSDEIEALIEEAALVDSEKE
jgi:hypothetical protein